MVYNLTVKIETDDDLARLEAAGAVAAARSRLSRVSADGAAEIDKLLAEVYEKLSGES